MPVCENCSAEREKNRKACPSCGSPYFSWRGMKRSCKGGVIATLAFYLPGFTHSLTAPFNHIVEISGNLLFVLGWLIGASGVFIHFKEYFQKWGKSRP